MKKLFETPEVEIVSFENEIVTTNHDSIGDGDVNVGWDDLD